MLSWISRPLLILAAASIALALSGCAEERKPINKVQANALDKRFFVGNPTDPSDDPQFYWRNFVVERVETQPHKPHTLVTIADGHGNPLE